MTGYIYIDYMKLTIPFIFLLLSSILLTSCGPDGMSPEACEFDSRFSCAGFSVSIVDSESYENLIGVDKLIHPDSIVITNTRKDTLLGYRYLKFSDEWYTIENINPFEEITCFNQCLSDSAFTRTYYMYVGNGDMDTIDVFFPEMSQEPKAFFNETTGELPNDLPPNVGSGYSVFWFRKIIK